MSKQTDILLLVLALAAFAYFIYELVIHKTTPVGYACLFLGSMINLYRAFKKKKQVK